MEIVLWLACYCFCIVSMKHAMHGIQQNRYNLRRYVTWCRKRLQHRTFSFMLCIWFIPCIGIAFLEEESLIMKILTLLLLVYTYVLYQSDKQCKKVQPLVWTPRIQRLFIVLSLLILLWLKGCLSLLNLPFFSFTVCFQLCIPWLLMIVAQWILMPVEQSIRNWYMKDAKKTLQKYNHLIRIGITGSYGKTSTKNVMHQILSEKFYCFKTPKSYNNKMGITKSIREYLKPIHQVFISEMGADHVHEITQLAKFVEPQIAVVCAVGPQHLQTFHSIDNILNEKMQLIECLPKDGVGIINMDNDDIRNYTIRNTCKIIRYGIHQNGADIRAHHLECGPKGTKFLVDVREKTYSFQTILLGEHNVLNILAGLAVGDYLNVPWMQMQEAVARIPFIEHRLALTHLFPFTFIDNAYNSNPVSARLALDVLKKMPGRHILITPGFIDLGSVENEENRRFGEVIPQFCDMVILVGEHQTRYIYKGLMQSGMSQSAIYVVASTKEAMDLCMVMAKSSDTVLIENDLPDAFNN